MADVQIVAGGVSAAPLAYTVPGAQEIILKALFATFNGAAAASSFLPCIRIVAPGGKVVGEYITDTAVSAGSSAEVSFAPFLRGTGASAASGSTTSTTIADISFVGVGAAAEGSAVTGLSVPTPAGLANHDLLIVVFGFEGVAAASGPYVSDTGTATGWFRVLSQAPAGGVGTGLEVWAAVWETGLTTPFNFFAAQTVVAREVAYRGNADTVADAITITASSAVAGDNPVAPTVTTTVPKSWVVPAVAQALAAGAFVYPAAFTRRFDNARGGVSGNAEIAEGDAAQAAPGASGTTTITAASAGGTARGATATVVINPLVTTTTSVNTLIGLTAYAPAVDSTIVSSNPTVLTAVDAANAVVNFTTPDSGNVLIRLSAMCEVNNTSNTIYFGLLDGATSKGEGWALAAGGVPLADPGFLRINVELYVTGLTPGALHGYKFAYRLSGAATTGSIFAGPSYGRIVMEVWAAP